MNFIFSLKMLSIITNIRDEIEIYLIYIDGKYIFPLRLIIRRIKNKLNCFTSHAKRLLIDMICGVYSDDIKNNMNDVDDKYKQSKLKTIMKNAHCLFVVAIHILLFMILLYIFIF